MRKLGIILFFIAGIFLLIPAAHGQDVIYSQQFSQPMYYNPAFTGINTGVRARFSYRDQWPNLPVDFKSYCFSADVGDRGLPGSGGFGLLVNSTNDGIGLIKYVSVGLNMAVRVPISSLMVAQVGIKAAVVQKKVNWDDMVFADQLSERYGNIYQTSFIPPDASKKVYPDFGAGGLLQFSNPQGNMSGIIGFAADHIFRPDESFLSTGSSPIPRRYVAHADFVVSAGGGSASGMYSTSGANEPLKINPGLIYENQNGIGAIQVGMNMMKYNIYIGGWFRTTLKESPNSVAALLAGYRYTFADDMSIKFIYSYDLQVSAKQQGLGGAHEISIVLEFDRLSIFGGGEGGSSGYTPGRSFRSGSPLECPSFY